MSEAFVYCWTNIRTNKLYIGAHKGHSDDGYICSSKIMMAEYKLRPQDFRRTIVAEGKFNDIRKLETSILRSLDAANDPMFYNRHNGGDKLFNKAGYLSEAGREKMRTPKSKETIEKMKEALRSPERMKQLVESATGENNPMYGKTGSNNPNFGKKQTKEHKEKRLSQIRGRSRPDSVKKAVSKARKNKVSCYDLNGNYHYVTKEEFDSRADLVGLRKFRNG